MRKHKIILGDWSGDGHETAEPFWFETEDRFTTDVLAENYQKNVAEFGIDSTKFANAYSNPGVPTATFKALVELGVEFGTTDYRPKQEAYYITEMDMIEILMFLFGHGLEDFYWEETTDDTPLLIGGYDAALGLLNVGYGLY